MDNIDLHVNTKGLPGCGMFGFVQQDCFIKEVGRISRMEGIIWTSEPQKVPEKHPFIYLYNLENII